MKKTIIVFIILFLTSHKSKAQFDSTKVDLISTISCHLSNGWYNTIRIGSEFDEFELPFIDLSLCNYKIEENQTNICLGIAIFEIKNKDAILEKDWSLENSKIEFIYTKNFIIIIDYLENWNENYNLLLPDALSGIKDFFKLNFNNL
jgi:hypothetical protein